MFCGRGLKCFSPLRGITSKTSYLVIFFLAQCPERYRKSSPCEPFQAEHTKRYPNRFFTFNTTSIPSIAFESRAKYLKLKAKLFKTNGISGLRSLITVFIHGTQLCVTALLLVSDGALFIVLDFYVILKLHIHSIIMPILYIKYIAPLILSLT